MLGVALTIVLTQIGCQKSTKTVENQSPIEEHHSEESHTQKPPMQMQAETLPEDADLEKVVDLAVMNIEKGRETGDFNLMMVEGVMKLKAVLQRDSNNVRALHNLAMMSVESGQFEKAEKRFEKLILLQPENQEYQKLLADIRMKLGK